MSELKKGRFQKQISETYIRETSFLSSTSKIVRSADRNIYVNVKRKGSLGPLEDLVQCPLCLDKLTDPKMLPCQHTFCLYCLQTHVAAGSTTSSQVDQLTVPRIKKLLLQDEREMQCPTCADKTQLENGLESLEQLPGNLYIDSVLQLLEGGSPHSPAKMGSEARCIKCQTVCQFSEHCCQHCKQIFCGVCWSVHVDEIKDNLKSLLAQLEESHSRLDHRVEGFKDQYAQLEANVRKAAEMKIEEVKRQEEACLLQAKELKENGLKNSETLRERMRNMQMKIQGQEFDAITDDTQKVTYFMSLHRGTSALLDELSHWGDTRTIFDQTNFKIDMESEANLDAEAEDGDLTISKVRGIENPLENPDTLTLYYKSRSFTPRMTWTKCLRPAGVAIAPWATNNLYIAGTDSRHVMIIDRQKGKLLHRLTCSDMLCPIGIAISGRREEIYVTDKWNHCVHVFSKEGNHMRTLGSKGSAKGQFRSPEGIAVDANERLFVCDTGNDRIQIIDTADGIPLYQFGYTGRRVENTSNFSINYDLTELNVPTGIAVTEDKVVVADSGNRRIKVYTLAGEKLSEFGTLGKNKGQFRSPEVVAVDPMGFILVGDSGNARVQIFRPNGTLVRVFNYKGKLGWVSGLHVTPQLDIIVTDYKTNSVHVF